MTDAGDGGDGADATAEDTTAEDATTADDPGAPHEAPGRFEVPELIGSLSLLILILLTLTLARRVQRA